jgi:hypothetical protein
MCVCARARSIVTNIPLKFSVNVVTAATDGLFGPIVGMRLKPKSNYSVGIDKLNRMP